MYELPSLRWDQLAPVQFEELIYHLLNELGYQNVDWRKGTIRPSTTPDSGRDIEAQLKRQDPDGSGFFEHWFVQAKHYRSTLNVSHFRDAIDWAEAERPDVLLLAASGFLSNPAKDWIARYQREKRPHFRVLYWERPKLERLLREHPDLLARYFSEQDPVRMMWDNALRDWTNHRVLLDPDRLSVLFTGREQLGLDQPGSHEAKYFLLLSEYANGAPDKRDWIEVFAPADALVLLPGVVLTLAYDFWSAREQERGWATFEEEGIFGVLPSLVRVLLLRGVSPNLAADLLWSPHRYLSIRGPDADKRAALRMRRLLLGLTVTPLLEHGIEICANVCGASALEGDWESRSVVFDFKAECKFNLHVKLGDEREADRAQVNLCPVAMFAMFTVGAPPNLSRRFTKRELVSTLKSISLLLRRNQALSSDPEAVFEKAFIGPS